MMAEMTTNVPIRTEHQSSVRHGPEANSSSIRSESSAWRQSPPSPSPPSTTRPSQDARRTDPERGRASSVKPMEECSSNGKLSNLRQPPLTTPWPTEKPGEAQTANVERPIPPAIRQDEDQLDAPRLPSSSQANSRDWEKGLTGHQPSCRSHHPAPSPTDFATTPVYIAYDEVDEEHDPKKHAMWILIYLSALSPLFSLFTCLYTLLASSLVLVLSPLCLCTTGKNPIIANLQRFLVPPLKLQLRLIYSNFINDEEDGDEDSGTSCHSRSRSNSSRIRPTTMLVLINILAPLYAIGISVAAWVAAGFWFFAAILGDPNRRNNNNNNNNNNRTAAIDPDDYDNDDDDDDDGKTAVMIVRRWWEKWLVHGLV